MPILDNTTGSVICAVIPTSERDESSEMTSKSVIQLACGGSGELDPNHQIRLRSRQPHEHLRHSQMAATRSSRPSSVGQNEESVILCAGCRDGIFDQYFLSVSQEAWHCQCLKCSVCTVILDSHMICYYRDGLILCKDDYCKRYQKGHCTVCSYPIRPDEFVMRLRDFIFHIGCFRCTACSTTLHTGDCIGMRDDGSVYCQRHFSQHDTHHHDHPISGHCRLNKTDDATRDSSYPNNNSHLHCQTDSSAGIISPLISTQQFDGQNRVVPVSTFFPSHQHHVTDGDGAAAAHKQVHSSHTRSGKSRSRRRKDLTTTEYSELNRSSVASLAAHDAMRISAEMDQCYLPNTIASCTAAAGQTQHTFTSSSGSEASSSSRLASTSPGLHMSNLTHSHTDSSSPTTHQQHQRTKRMRTSFKHQQLRAMKHYFSINHNPDAKDLKQLAQKTGLTKRVLQVWFQNARAKYRRSQLKQDPNRVMEASPIAKASDSPRRSVSVSPPAGCWTITDNAASSVKNESLQYPMSTGSESNSRPTTHAESYY